MKKSLFIGGFLALTSAASHGQGQIHFTNYYSTSAPKITLNTWTFFYPPGPTLGSSYSAQLAYFIGATTDQTALTPLNYNDGLADLSPVPFGLGVVQNNGDPYAGWFDGGFVTIPGITAANAGLVTFQVRIFQNSSPSVPIEVSPLFQGAVQAHASDLPPNLPIWEIVPEPASPALIGLGATALCFLGYRRKAKSS